MSAEETLRLGVQATLARGLAAPEVARRAGLAAASEVWGGDAPRDRPAWYLWLEGRPGAWQLELADARIIDGGTVHGRFTVRHYPAAGDPALGAFDAEERAAASRWLDRTGTPRIDTASRIPERLFTVGAVEWVLDREREASVLVATSLDRLRSRGAGGLLRDVPGWSMPVLSALGALHAQVERRAAVQLLVATQPGFELVEQGAALHPRDAADVVQGEAYLAFGPAGGCGGAARRLLASLRDEGARVVADVALAPGSPAAGCAYPGLELEVSAAWFGGEAHFEGSACGC